MASGWRGVAAGALALVAVETLVQPSASGRISGLFALPGSWAHKFLDPSVPAFHLGKSSSSSSSSKSGAIQHTPPQYTNPGGGAGAPGSDLLPKLLPGDGTAKGNTTSTTSGTGSSVFI